MKQWIMDRTHTYQRKGGKISRRSRVKMLIRALEDISANEKGVSRPPQIGRRHIHQFYARHSHLSPRTLTDYGYAFDLLWQLLDRPGSPPKPPTDIFMREGGQN